MRFKDKKFYEDDAAKTEYFATHDSKLIATKTWKEVGPLVAIVYFLHGYSNSYSSQEELMNRLAEAGFRVHAWDMRGHGRNVYLNKGQSSFLNIESLEKVRQDIPYFMDAIDKEEPAPKFLKRIGATAESHPDHIMTAIMPPRRIFIREREVRKQLAQDPYHLYGLNLNTVHEGFQAINTIKTSESWEITVPVLLIHAEGDRICDAKATQKVFTKLVAPQKEIMILPKGPHFDQIVTRIIDWIKDAAVPKTSE